MKKHKTRENNVNTKKLQVFVTEDTYKKLKEISEQKNMSMGKIIDSLLGGDQQSDPYFKAISESLNYISSRSDQIMKHLEKKKGWFS